MSSHIPKVQDGPVPLPTQGAHGEDDKKTATATCYCGTVQLEFVRARTPFVHNNSTISLTFLPTANGRQAPRRYFHLQLHRVSSPYPSPIHLGNPNTISHSCRKITASMFASNFIVADAGVKHLRGEDKLTRYAQRNTIKSGCEMANFFCSVCGTLMYRVGTGFPGNKVMRIGTIDDFTLHETKLKPRIEQFTKDRVAWFKGGEGVEQVEGSYYNGKEPEK